MCTYATTTPRVPVPSLNKTSGIGLLLGRPVLQNRTAVARTNISSMGRLLRDMQHPTLQTILTRLLPLHKEKPARQARECLEHHLHTRVHAILQHPLPVHPRTCAAAATQPLRPPPTEQSRLGSSSNRLPVVRHNHFEPSCVRQHSFNAVPAFALPEQEGLLMQPRHPGVQLTSL